MMTRARWLSQRAQSVLPVRSGTTRHLVHLCVRSVQRATTTTTVIHRHLVTATTAFVPLGHIQRLDRQSVHLVHLGSMIMMVSRQLRVRCALWAPTLRHHKSHVTHALAAKLTLTRIRQQSVRLAHLVRTTLLVVQCALTVQLGQRI